MYSVDARTCEELPDNFHSMFVLRKISRHDTDPPSKLTFWSETIIVEYWKGELMPMNKITVHTLNSMLLAIFREWCSINSYDRFSGAHVGAANDELATTSTSIQAALGAEKEDVSIDDGSCRGMIST